MIIDNYIDRVVGKKTLDDVKKKDAVHVRSGKLSASMLGDPLQWQVLKVLGVEGEPLDEYVVRKFLRGNHVESWIMQYLDADATVLNDKQDFANYRGVNGYIDAMVNTAKWDFPKGLIPVEIKSVANSKFSRIVGTASKPGNGPDRGHCLQAVLYALSKGTEWCAVMYVAADDYRVQTFMIKVEDFKAEVDKIIDEFNEAMKSKIIPEFKCIEKWQENVKYNRYPEWMSKNKKELLALSKKLFKNER